MGAEFHYVVESVFWRRSVGDTRGHNLGGIAIDDALVTMRQTFEDESPIKAREMAFRHFRSVVDVLYDGLGMKYTTDAQARIDLQNYFEPGNAVHILNNYPSKKYDGFDDLYSGLEIYMVIDQPLEQTDGTKGQKILIHGIWYVDEPGMQHENSIATLEGLCLEHDYYINYHYDINQYSTTVSLEHIGGSRKHVLKTPFNWEAFLKIRKGQKLFD